MTTYASRVRRPPAAVIAFVAWTVIVWATRVRNVTTTAGWTAGDLILPVLFVVLGLGVAALFLAPTPPALRVAGMRGAAALTTVIWVVRVAFIAVHDHPAAFIAVHVALAVVSVGLAAWAARAVAPVSPRVGDGLGDTATI